MSENGEYEQVLTQLYSRKMTRKAFGEIRADYKRQTGKDLCSVVSVAHKRMITKISGLPTEKLEDKLRTDMFKLSDYSAWLKFCHRGDR